MCKEKAIERLQKFLKFYPDTSKTKLAEEIGVDIKTLNLLLTNAYQPSGERGLVDKINGWIDKKENERNALVLGKLKKFIDDSGKSQADIAQGIGISATALSQMLNGQYAGNITNVCDKLELYIRRETERNKYGLTRGLYVENSITKRIWGALKIAHINQKMVAVVGPAGCGKTTTAEEYMQRDNTVIYERMDNVTKTAYLLHRIGKAVGVNLNARNNAILFQRIIAKLDGSQRLLIIDEAQKLEIKEFEVLRDIYDQGRYGRIGIVLMGHENIYDRMFGNKSDLYAQMLSRTFPVRIRDVKDDDIDKIIEAYCPGANGKIKEYLFALGKGKGKFRMITNTLEQAQVYVKLSGREKIGLDDIKKSASYVQEFVNIKID